ncbi:RluA family pseudouridine synthase [uncultured Cycloclasticus sp.]|uniref:RluA family pseudouridine synthase n=1 Tax=uncultured Cycloclasticus sp. TaxID=172194 RepID=UPI00258AC072|nr:RluA family pseudouridine synthase [uncultured Cycloclasticus sp.]
MKTEAYDKVRFIEVDENSVGQRLDNFLMTQLKGVPKSHIYKIIRRGEVRINKGRAKNIYRLKVNDLVRVPPVKMEEKSTSSPAKWMLSSLEERVIYEDEHLLVLNKPSGMAVHGGTANSHGVIETLRFLRPEERYLELVHRLDKATSGCLLIAKNRKMLNGLQSLLRNRTISKTYTALLCGVIHKQSVNVNAPLEKRTLESGEHRVRVHPEGKKSETLFEKLAQYKGATLVSASPKTGRTHQIRVHAKHFGHPIAGDERYSTPAQYKSYREKGLMRLFLHASKLEFIHPLSEKKVIFEAPLDNELEMFLKTL